MNGGEFGLGLGVNGGRGAPYTGKIRGGTTPTDVASVKIKNTSATESPVTINVGVAQFAGTPTSANNKTLPFDIDRLMADPANQRLAAQVAMNFSPASLAAQAKKDVSEVSNFTSSSTFQKLFDRSLPRIMAISEEHENARNEND